MMYKLWGMVLQNMNKKFVKMNTKKFFYVIIRMILPNK